MIAWVETVLRAIVSLYEACLYDYVLFDSFMLWLLIGNQSSRVDIANRTVYSGICDEQVGRPQERMISIKMALPNNKKTIRYNS